MDSMSKHLLAALLIGSLSFSLKLDAQQGRTPGHGFVGSWRLRSTERIDGAAAVAIPNPQGLIVFDSAGHTVEVITQLNRKPFASNRTTAEEALDAFNTFSGFWGSFKADEKTKIITYRPQGAVNPSLMGQDLRRGYELDGDRLVITS